ncbi:MAG: hypothetical protein WDZ76_10760 [Pseudohongiellaceae bacterium]
MKLKSSALLHAVLLSFLSAMAQAQILPPITVYNGETGILEIPNLVFDGRVHYIELTMEDHIALMLKVDEASLVDITPDGSTLGKTAADLVGGWTMEGEDTVFTFNSDATWSMSQPAGVDEEACPDGGIESGTFRYAAFTGVFTPAILTDENGDCGLSGTDTVVRLLPDGNTMTLLVGSDVAGTLILNE